LYISGEKKRKVLKTILAYIAITAFCWLFGYVYERFSHGVYSDFMVYMFLFPLIGGLVPFVFIRFTPAPFPGRFSQNAYNSGIAALTLASLLRGVFDIYGTISNYVKLYWILGIFLTIIGIISYLVGFEKGKHIKRTAL